MDGFWFYLFFVISFNWYNVLGRKLPPLMEERGLRKTHSGSECIFGKQHKELGSSWFADLGPPFDVMYCIKCECLKVFKEGRVFAQVNCSNIAKNCPQLTCDDQVQVVGRCCKVCRNDVELTEVLQDVAPINPVEEEEKSYKHYAALLTNSFYTLKMNAENGSSVNSFGQTATGRFTLHKRNLYYSFYTSMFPLSTRPKSIQFVDNIGNIVEEQQIPSFGSLYQNLTNKICGVWRRVPGEYRSLLKDDKLSVILIWEEYDVRIRGILMRYRPLTTEVLSSLMVPLNDSLTDSAAGTAIISISTMTPSIHVMIVFIGLLNTKRKNDNLVHLRLFAADRAASIFEESIIVQKPSADLNIIEYRTAVTVEDLEALTQQRLTLSLVSARYRDSKIQGRIISRVHCELFQAVLSSLHQSPTNSINYPQKLYYRSTRASGLTWMFFDNTSQLRYYMTLDNVVDVSVELVTARYLNTVERLAFASSGNVSSVAPKYFEQLYNEELAVNVAKVNGNNPSLIRGRLFLRLVAGSRDTSMPYLLKRSDTSIPAEMVGLLWARIDADDCSLHYDISLAGKDVDDYLFELSLEDIPFLAPGAPVNRRWLDEFKGSTKEGFSLALPQNLLTRLKTGVVYLDLWDMKRGQSVLKTRWDKIFIPESCLPQNPENSTVDNNIPSYRLLHEENEQLGMSKCYHGLQFYDHDTQWTSTIDECSMCHCNHGVTKCDVILCPELNCPQKFTVTGSCCRSCLNTSQIVNGTQSSCSLGGQTYAAGSAWYPYIPPNGFATCTVCYCDATTLQAKCGKVECPPLTCDEKQAYRPHKKSCCKICPNRTRTQGYDITVSDQQDLSKYERDILLAGGCKYPIGGPYENGREWHPRIHFHGEQKCVTCRCKDGKINCERKKCVKHSCDDPCCMKKSKCGKTKRFGANSEELHRPE